MTDAATWIRPELSGEAAALAIDLGGRYDDLALSRARMQLYAALNDGQFAQADLLAQVCFILMHETAPAHDAPRHIR